MLMAKSTVLTGGLGDLVIATAALGGALLVSFLTLAAPLAVFCAGHSVFMASATSAPVVISSSASVERPR